MGWSRPIYPAIVAQLCEIAKRKGMTIRWHTNLYLQIAVAYDGIMEREAGLAMLEGVFIRCIEKGEIDELQQSGPVVLSVP
jgi:hypothetical protein